MNDALTAFQSQLLDDLVGVGVFEWRVGENSLVWSQGLIDIYGLSSAPTADAGFLEFVHPDDRDNVEAQTLSYLESGDSYDHEFRIVRPDGEIRVVHGHGVIERSADGRAVALRGINVDVTSYRLAELSGSSRATEVGAAIYEYDVREQSSRWSLESFKLFDLPPNPHQHPHRLALEKVHRDDVATVIQMIERASRNVGPYEREYRIRREDGDLRWILDRGESFGPVDANTGLTRRVRGTLVDVTELKQTEARLQAAHDTFRHLVEHSPFGIYTVDADLRILQVSDGADRVFAGVSPVEGRDLSEVLHVLWPEPFAAEAIEKFRHTLATGEAYHAPPLIERREDIGEVESYDWKVERILLPDGNPGAVCHFYDLSEREARDTLLRETTERLELAYEASGMGAWDLDLRSGTAVWSRQLYDLLGVDPATPANSALLYEVTHPQDRQGLAEIFERSIHSGHTFRAVFRVIRGDGEVRHIAGRGRIVERDGDTATRMIGVYYDVTERHRTEELIQESEQRLRLILDNSVAFMGILDRDGTLLEANAPALAAADLTRDDVIGLPFWKGYWWSHDDKVANRLQAAIEDARDGRVVRYDEVVRMRDGALMTVDFMLAPIAGALDETVQIVASGFDITEREAASAHAKLLMQEVSHRSKNLLTLIQIVARQTKRDDPEDFYQRFEDRLKAIAASQDLLVDDHWNRVTLHDLVKTVIAHFGDLIGTRIHLDGPLVEITAEGARAIGMAIHEMATNAGKYGALSTEAGEVRFAWSLETDSGGAPCLVLDWQESGGPAAAEPKRNGFGSFVIDSMVQSSLSADVDLAYPPEGFTWRAVCREGFAGAGA